MTSSAEEWRLGRARDAYVSGRIDAYRFELLVGHVLAGGYLALDTLEPRWPVLCEEHEPAEVTRMGSPVAEYLCVRCGHRWEEPVRRPPDAAALAAPAGVSGPSTT